MAAIFYRANGTQLLSGHEAQVMFDFLFAQDEICHGVRNHALGLVVLRYIQVVHVERLVQVHLLQKVLPNRNETLFYLIQLPQEFVGVFVQLECLVSRSLILNRDFFHDWLVCADV